MGKQLQISIVENGKQLLKLTTLKSTSEEYTIWLTSNVYKKFNYSLIGYLPHIIRLNKVPTCYPSKRLPWEAIDVRVFN